MPLRPVRRPPDLERVARILRAGSARPSGRASGEEDEPGGWVPSPPRALVVEAPEEVEDAPGSGFAHGSGLPSGSGVASAVRRLARRATEEDEVARLDADLRRARRPAVLTVPDELSTGRSGLSSAAVVSLLALVVAISCAFVLRVLWAERSASAPDLAPGAPRSVQVVGGTAVAATVPTPVRGVTPAPASSASGAVAPGPAAPATASGTELVMHVVGQVVRPGLVRLRPGARVADAIAAAGGPRAGADLAALNLARVVLDGEQIRVTKPGEPPGAAGGGAPQGGSPISGTGGAGPAGAPSPPVSLNSADVSALDGLPGVGPVLAQRIVDWRTEHGHFTSVDELGEVSGIGDKMMAQLRPRVTL